MSVYADLYSSQKDVRIVSKCERPGRPSVAFLGTLL